MAKHTILRQIIFAATTATLTIWPPSFVSAQTPELLDQPSGSSGGQVIRLRNTQQSVQQPEIRFVEPNELQQQALIAIALAIDNSSLSDLEAAIALLTCGEDCGPVIDAQLLLHRAARDSIPEIIERLLAAGASIDHVSPPLGWTPLLLALQAAQSDNARTLVARGADTAIVGLDGTNAPFMADLLGLGDLIPFPPVRLSRADANRTLLLAIEANNLAAVRFALEAGADPNATAPLNGWSALMIASFNGYFAISAELLDDHHGEPTRLVRYVEPTNGMNALHAAVIGFSDEPDGFQYSCVIDLLRDRGASINTRTNEGLSAKDIAANVIDPNGWLYLSLRETPMFHDDCWAEFAEHHGELELVDANPSLTGIPAATTVQEQNGFTGSQVELVMALQRELDFHNCGPGPIDGSYGQRSARALDIYNFQRPGTCTELIDLDSIGRSEPSPAWRAAAISNLTAIGQCTPSPVCRTGPVEQGQVEANPNLQPSDEARAVRRALVEQLNEQLESLGSD